MKLKKLMAIVLTSAITATALIGCGNSGEEGSSKGSASEESNSGDKITINLWEADDSNVQGELDNLIKKYEEENSDTKINRSHYETEELRKQFLASLGGDGPDLVLGPNDNLGVFVSADLIQDLGSFMGDGYFDAYDDKALEAAVYDGKQYMLPDRNGNELLLMYNKDLVSKAPKTMEELIEVGKKLQEEGKIEYPLVFNKVEPFFSIPFYTAFGGEIFDDPSSPTAAPTLDTEATANWMKFLKDLNDDGVVPKDCDADVADSLFKEGKAAFIINGPWGLSGYSEANINTGITSIPSINGKDSAPLTAVKGYTVSKTVEGDKAEAVKSFLEFMNTKESQISLALVHKQLPTVTEAINDEKITNDEEIQAQIEPIQKGIPMPIITQMRFIWDAIRPVQQEIFAGTTSPEDAPSKIQSKAEEGIKAAGL